MSEMDVNKLKISPPEWKNLNLREDVWATEWDQMDLIDEYYQSTICHVCKSITPTLKRCGGCRLFSYCSKEHQKTHWKTHKDFCKMMQKMLVTGRKRLHLFDLDSVQLIDHDAWKLLRTSMPEIWEEKLNRSITSSENQVWMFPRVCEVCRYYDQDILVDCKVCYSVAYCSEEHKQSHSQNHNKYCESLKVCYEINKHLYDVAKLPEIEISISKDLLKLPKSMQVCLDECIKLKNNDKHSRMLASDTLSPVTTILFGLEQLGYVTNRVYYKEELTIHFVGAALYEVSMNLSTICSFIFEWIRNLKKLTIVLIGPETPDGEVKKEITPNSQDPRSINIYIAHTYYDDYLVSESYKKPDLIIGFNCGLHEFQYSLFDTWTTSIKSLFAVRNIGLIITSYTEKEGKLDLIRLLPYLRKKNLIVRCKKNQYSSLRPVRDWETENVPIFYVNNYLSVMKT